LHGPAVIGGPLIAALDSAARFLERGWLEKAKACITRLSLPPLSAPGEALKRARRSSALFSRIAPNVFEPDKHPRWPAGSPNGTGGEFRPGDGAAALPVADQEEPKQPRTKTKDADPKNLAEPKSPAELPTDRLPTRTELNRYGRLQSELLKGEVTADRLNKWTAIVQLVMELPDVVDNARAVMSRIISRFDEPMTIDELIDRTNSESPPKWPAYERHHIVEQTPNEGKIPEEKLQGRDNIVSIPYYIHRDISDWYSTPNKDYGGKTPRDFIKGKSFDEQYQFGLEAMRRLGAIK
jgi:hypothetical protein